MKVLRCKRCEATDLVDIIKDSYDLNWENILSIGGMQCTECGCFHFEIENTEVVEFAGREQIDNSKETAGAYITDYDRALMEKNGEV